MVVHDQLNEREASDENKREPADNRGDNTESYPTRRRAGWDLGYVRLAVSPAHGLPLSLSRTALTSDEGVGVGFTWGEGGGGKGADGALT
jgi:hypothetical protein